MVNIYANPILNRTGLGNMLFPWARAESFCRRFGGQILAPQWVNVLRVGPWLRCERDKRYYFSHFSNTRYIHGFKRMFLLHWLPHVPEADGVTLMQKQDTKKKRIVDFVGMDGFFSSFLSEQPYLAQRLSESVSPAIRAQLDGAPHEPFIAVHIRRGDFKKIGQTIENDWYLRALDAACKRHSADGCDFEKAMQIRVFSDESPDALQFITSLPNVVFNVRAPAILDLLLMSRCRALVATSRSTFSMWAAFLGQMPSYWHPCSAPPPFSLSPHASITFIQ